MNTATATATEMQNNFGRYLNLVMSGHEIIVTKNGHEVGRFIPKDAAVSYLHKLMQIYIPLPVQFHKVSKLQMIPSQNLSDLVKHQV